MASNKVNFYVTVSISQSPGVKRLDSSLRISPELKVLWLSHNQDQGCGRHLEFSVLSHTGWVLATFPSLWL